MKQIGTAMLMYSHDYGDEFPPAVGTDGLGLLRSTGFIIDSKIFYCPSSQKSYIYLAEGFNFQKISEPSIFPVVVEYPENHKGNVYILYADGHVSSLTISEEHKIENITDLIKLLSKYLPKEDQERLLKNAKRYTD